ncbi:MAG: hypothetical protein WC690_05220 [bacterium]
MRRSKNGFSLIEAILATVLLAASFMSISYLLSNTTLFNVDIDVSNIAILLADQKMEETTAQDFTNIANVLPTSFGGNFANYSYEVIVDYVDPSNLNASVVGPTDYKRIKVDVTAGGWSGKITLYDIKTKL